MPPVPTPSGVAPSHLGVILRAIVETIGEAGDGTPVMVGEHYATKPRGVGSPPHVIIVPEPGGGECAIAYAYEMGRAAKQTHACDVIVRAAESGDDVSRYDAAYDLSDLVVSTVRRMCAGRVEFGKPIGKYPTPFTVDSGAGVQLSWSFTYDRDIRTADAIAAVKPSPPDNAPDQPQSPPGTLGTLDDIEGTTVPKD